MGVADATIIGTQDRVVFAGKTDSGGGAKSAFTLTGRLVEDETFGAMLIMELIRELIIGGQSNGLVKATTGNMIWDEIPMEWEVGAEDTPLGAWTASGIGSGGVEMHCIRTR